MRGLGHSGWMYLTRVGLGGNLTHLCDKQNQEDRVSDLLLRFEPLTSIVTLGLEAFRVPHGWVVSRDICVVSLRQRPSGIRVLRGRSWIVRGLIVTAILPTHNGSERKGLVVPVAAGD